MAMRRDRAAASLGPSGWGRAVVAREDTALGKKFHRAPCGRPQPYDDAGEKATSFGAKNCPLFGGTGKGDRLPDVGEPGGELDEAFKTQAKAGVRR